MTTSHIFIAGLPRTGSTLTRGIINASDEAYVGGESHYFAEPTHLGLLRRPGYRDRFRKVGDLATDAGLSRIVDHIFALRGKNYWARMAANADRGSFETELRESERSDRALLDVAMAQVARGRPIRGEKTPHHIYNVPTLLEWYPNARIVHTFRDPRAVYVSLRHKERPEKLRAAGLIARRLGPAFDVYSIANLIRSWRTMTRLHETYARRYPDRYMLIRFEDMVADPPKAAMGLSSFLGIEYRDAMLEQVVHNSSFAAKATGSGIDEQARERWRQYLPSAQQRIFARRLSADLEAFGYVP